jgi:hypothetical protein
MKLSTATNIRERVGIKRSKRRQELINSVHNGFEVAGDALQELRDDEHWKDTHTSWIVFCKETFGISKTKLFNLIKYTEVTGSLSRENQPKITSIEQALVLGRASEKERDEIILRAENNGGITAENLKFHSAKKAKKKAVTGPVTKVPDSGQSSSGTTESETPPKPKTSSSKKEEKVELDDIGTPVPMESLSHWNKRDEVQGILTKISAAKKAFKDAAKGDHPLYSRVYQNALDYLSRAYHVVSDCKPYTICTRCMGSPSLQPEGCSFCASTGVISRIRWKNNADPRVKQMRMLANADYARSHNLPAPTEQPEELEEV